MIQETIIREEGAKQGKREDQKRFITESTGYSYPCSFLEDTWWPPRESKQEPFSHYSAPHWQGCSPRTLTPHHSGLHMLECSAKPQGCPMLLPHQATNLQRVKWGSERWTAWAWGTAQSDCTYMKIDSIFIEMVTVVMAGIGRRPRKFEVEHKKHLNKWVYIKHRSRTE